MVKVQDFMDKVVEIQNRDPKYRLGDDGRNGFCDCIGLLIGAIRLSGGSWKGTHGSNYAARYEMEFLREVSKPSDLEAGWAIYKFRPPGARSNRLPSKYASHPDQRDHYHVGVVLSVSPLKIIHCSKTSKKDGIQIDTTMKGWGAAGPLSKLDYASVGVVVPMPKELTAALPARILRVIRGMPLMRGEDVRTVQVRLVSKGYSVGPKGIDGIFGWDTQKAVRAFQLDAFPASPDDWDGVVGASTLAALMEGGGSA